MIVANNTLTRKKWFLLTSIPSQKRQFYQNIAFVIYTNIHLRKLVYNIFCLHKE